ncbi:putative transposase insF for insertion sequence IS3A/B/C/D/E/fA domain protein, partial [Escherichia coli 2866350]
MPRAPGGPQRLVYVVSAADKDKHASAVPPTLRSVVLAAFTRSKQRYGAPRLTDELRAQGYPFNVK